MLARNVASMILMGDKEANVPMASKIIAFENAERKVYRDCQLVIVDECSFASASDVQKTEERVKKQERLSGVKVGDYHQLQAVNKDINQTWRMVVMELKDERLP